MCQRGEVTEEFYFLGKRPVDWISKLCRGIAEKDKIAPSIFFVFVYQAHFLLVLRIYNLELKWSITELAVEFEVPVNARTVAVWVWS